MKKKPIYVEATSYGEVVHQAFSARQNAVIFSRTSKGLFIKGESRWMVFLSKEPHRSPLTINLPLHSEIHNKCNRHDRVLIELNRLFFPQLNIGVSIIDPKKMWINPKKHAFPADGHFLLLLSNLKVIAEQLGKNQSRNTYIGLLQNLIEDKNTADLYASQRKILEDIRSLIASLREDDKPLIRLSKFLGKGSGLTPSGDDFIIGFLLILNRYGKDLVNSLDALNHGMVKTAYQKTNTLSANLIECAASGKADERLVSLCDLLMNKTILEKKDFDELSTYGSSSGFDSFIGMISGMIILGHYLGISQTKIARKT